MGESIDLRGQQSPVIHQGYTRQTCLAVAATGGHEFIRAGQRLSIEHLWANAEARGGVDASGATMTSIRDGAAVDGQCEEAIWPYNPVTPTPRPPVIPEVFRAATGQVTNGHDVRPAREGLRAGRAVVVGLQVTRSFQLGLNLPIDLQAPEEPVLFNHAVLAVGFDEDTELLLVKNSWGTKWSDAGYAPVTYRYMRRYALRYLELSNS